MRDKLHEYLLDRPGGASPRELLDLVFTQPGADPEFGPRFLHAMLGADPRFVWRAADGTWNARVKAPGCGAATSTWSGSTAIPSITARPSGGPGRSATARVSPGISVWT